eukprot:423427_1
MPKRSEEEQKAADEFHHEKCKTTKFICAGSCILFIGIILLISAVGLYNANDLSQFSDSQYKEKCYVLKQGSACNSETCTRDMGCTQNTYYVKLDDDFSCSDPDNNVPGNQKNDSCSTWANGCVAISFIEVCTKNPQYETGDLLPCYGYGEKAEGNSCHEAGKLDPNDEWGGQHTTYIVLLVFAIILIIISIILFIFGCMRCLCKKIDDDILGETNGTGCYCCGDYERMCYGEGTGHATIVREQDKNLPIKDHTNKKTNEAGRKKKKRKKDEEYDDEEAQELR